MTALTDARDARRNVPGAVLTIDDVVAPFSSLTVTHQLRQYPRLQARLRPNPPTLNPGGVAKVNFSWNGNADEADYITAILDRPEASFDPAVSHLITAAGRSRALGTASLNGLLLGGPPSGATEQSIWEAIIAATGLDALLTVQAAFEGLTLVNTGFAEVKPGGIYAQLLEELDLVSGNWSTWENPHGTLNRQRVNGIDSTPGVIYRAYTEGVNLLSLGYAPNRQQVCNAILVRGSDVVTTGTFPTASTTASNSALEAGEEPRTAKISSDLLETVAECEFVRDRVFPVLNRVPKTIRFRTVGDPLAAPGAFITVDSPRLGISDSQYWVVTSVTQEVQTSGAWFTQQEAEDVVILS